MNNPDNCFLFFHQSPSLSHITQSGIIEPPALIDDPFKNTATATSAPFSYYSPIILPAPDAPPEPNQAVIKRNPFAHITIPDHVKPHTPPTTPANTPTEGSHSTHWNVFGGVHPNQSANTNQPHPGETSQALVLRSEVVQSNPEINALSDTYHQYYQHVAKLEAKIKELEKENDVLKHQVAHLKGEAPNLTVKKGIDFTTKRSVFQTE